MRTRIRRRALPIAAAAALLTVAGVLLNPVSAQFGDVVQFDIGGLTKPTGITTAKDGTMWFVERGTNTVGHLHADGSFALTPIGRDNAEPWGVVVGPDGAVWFTERKADMIGRLDLDTGVILELPLAAGSNPNGITVAGGDLWVTERAGRLARVDTATHEVRDVVDFGAGTDPFGIATAPDGSIWLTLRMVGRIVRYDPASGSMSTFQATSFADPRGIDVAPDGTVWFAEWFSGKLGRLDPATGRIDELAIPKPDGITTLKPGGVTVGPGGIWLALEAAAYAVRYKPTTGTFDEFPLWMGGQPLSIVTGPDGNLWVTEPGAGKIARVEAPDSTKPTIDIVSPADGATLVQGDALTADYSCADEEGGSGLATCDGMVADGASLDTSAPGDFTFSVTATDNEGNSRTKTVTYHVLKPRPKDTTAPSITISTPSRDATYLLGDTVRADYACADEDGGSGVVSCAGPVPSGDPIDTSGTGSHTFTVDAVDASGNTASASVSYTVERPKPADTTPPAIALDVPQDGAAFMVGDRPTAEFSCSDEGGSGLTSCEGTLADGAVIDTSVPGIFSFTVRASDGAGNRTSVASTYVVFKEWGGKLELPPAVNEIAAGSAVPIWFNLGDSAAASAKGATSPASTPIDCATHAPTGATQPASVSPTGTRSPSGRVMYVWKTDRSWTGTCRAFTLGIAAPTTLYLHFS